MADNSAALRRSRRQDSTTKRRHAAETLQAMIEAGEPISFPAVARRAGVSVSLLYADTELASRVAEARARQHEAGRARAWRLPARSLVTEQSLRVDLANAKDQVRRLSEELGVLRERLARQLGADADLARGRATSPILDELEQRAADLETDNAELRRRVAELEDQVRELNDTLDAARGMNRELMSEFNRSSPMHTRPGRPDGPTRTTSRRGTLRPSDPAV